MFSPYESKALVISLNQLLKLSAAYAMAITHQAEILDTDTHKLSIAFSQKKSTWGVQNPQPVALDSRNAQTVQVVGKDLFKPC